MVELILQILQSCNCLPGLYDYNNDWALSLYTKSKSSLGIGVYEQALQIKVNMVITFLILNNLFLYYKNQIIIVKI